MKSHKDSHQIPQSVDQNMTRVEATLLRRLPSLKGKLLQNQFSDQVHKLTSRQFALRR